MEHTLKVVAASLCLLISNSSYAQSGSDTASKKHGTTIEWDDEGMRVSGNSDEHKKEHRSHQSDYMIVDVGTNFMQDKTDYSDPRVRSFLNVPANRQNSSLFNLEQNKSINVNIYFWMERFRLLSNDHQKINISTGLGLQLYNFRYENNIDFTRNPSTVTLDSISFKKDKLAFDYLNVPLMLTFKTRLTRKEWLIYGVGVTGGYNICTWTKQESSERGKQKLHDMFDFSPFNSCLTAEIGISSLRFYASYQVNSIYTNNGMNQHPICVGIRID